VGVKVADVDVVSMVAASGLPPWGVTVNVAPLTVDPCTASLNVTVTVAPIAMLPAPFAGFSAVTVGGVVSPAGAVAGGAAEAAAAEPFDFALPPQPALVKATAATSNQAANHHKPTVTDVLVIPTLRSW
jgi:hypothetical protein